MSRTIRHEEVHRDVAAQRVVVFVHELEIAQFLADSHVSRGEGPHA